MKKLLLSFCSVVLIASSFARGIQFETALTWMFDNGLTMYNSSQEFRPNDKITRGETAKFVSKYAEVIGLSKGNNSCDFNDIGSYDGTLVPHIIESCKYGLLKGSNGLFMPSNTITEAEAMTLIIRSYEGMQDETTNPWYVNYFNKAKGLGLLNDADTLDSVGNTAITRERLGTWFYALGWKLEQGIIQSKIPLNNGGTITNQQIDIFGGSQSELFVPMNNTSTSFIFLGNNSNDLYYTKNNKIYFNEDDGEFIVEGTDNETFRHVAFFGILASNGQMFNNYYGYAVDKNTVYYRGKPISGSDPYSLVAMNMGYAVDKNAVYFRGIKMPCADRQTFFVINDTLSFGGDPALAKDKNYSYIDGNPMNGGNSNCYIDLPQLSVPLPAPEVEETRYRDYDSHTVLHTDFNPGLDVTIQENFNSTYEPGQKVTITVQMSQANQLTLGAKTKDVNITLVEQNIDEGQNTYTYTWTIPNHLEGEYIRFNALVYGDSGQEYYNTSQGFEIVAQKNPTPIKWDFQEGEILGRTSEECSLAFDESIFEKTYAVGDTIKIGLLPNNISIIRDISYQNAPTNSAVTDFNSDEITVENNNKVNVSFKIPTAIKNSYVRFYAQASCKTSGGVRMYSLGGIYVK